MATEELVIPLCRHIKTNGLRCQSPALAAEPFCYFHARLHRDHPMPLTGRKIISLFKEGYAEAIIGGGEDPMQIARAYPHQNEFNFPALEDAQSIQLAASMLFHATAQGQIHLRRARLLRDFLRVANASDRRVEIVPTDASATVRQVDRTPDGVAIAPLDTQRTSVTRPATSSPTSETQPNQYFGSNPNEVNILSQSPPATLAN